MEWAQGSGMLITLSALHFSISDMLLIHKIQMTVKSELNFNLVE